MKNSEIKQQPNREKRILEKYKDVFKALENFDKIGKLPVATINKLKKMKEKTGKSISQIIEEKIR